VTGAPAPTPGNSAPTRTTPLRSALYEGTVVHRRHDAVGHRFRARLFMVALDLDEVDELCQLHPLWSSERRNVVSFRRSDHLGPAEVPLAQAVRRLVAERIGREAAGPVVLLTHLRTFGWLFNPISVYFCYDEDGEEVVATVAEVTNTPWHERTAYVVAGTGPQVVAKQLHVSPFLPMELSHRFTCTPPGERLTVRVDDVDGDETVFSATLSLARVEATRSALGRVLVRYPLMTLRVSTGIYRQALALWWKQAPFHPHPDSVVPTGCPVRAPRAMRAGRHVRPARHARAPEAHRP
jgi:DUF1365 family protein